MNLIRYMSKNNTILKNNKDNIIEYKSMIHKIEHMISEIKDTGFDTSKYEDLLRKIKKDTEINSFQSVGYEQLKDGKIMIDYESIIKKLSEIEVMLSKFDMYAKAIATCRYVISRVNEDSDLQQIKYYANLIVMTLKNIKKIDTSYLEEEEKIIEEIYKIAYNILKIEVIITDKSDIYEYVKMNETDMYVFDKYIKDEINGMDLEDEKYKDLKSRLYDIKRNGIKTSYFDIELIKLLIKYNNNDYKERIIKKINLLLEKINEQGVVLISKSEEVEKIFSKINKTKKDNSAKLKNAILRILSLVLGTTLFLGCGYGIVRGMKKSCTYPVYKKVVTQYSELTDSFDTEEDETLAYKWNSLDDKTYVYEYSAWYYDETDDVTVRTVTKYDLSEITLDSIYEYLSYDLFKGEFVSENIYEYEENEQEKYSEEYKVIEQIEYIDLEKEEASSEWIVYTALVEMFYFVITMFVYLGVTDARFNNRGFNDIFSDLKNDFIKIPKNVRTIIRERVIIKKKLKEMLDIIYADDELRREFTKLFEENKYLLNNLEELERIINDVEIEDIKKRIRTLN